MPDIVVTDDGDTQLVEGASAAATPESPEGQEPAKVKVNLGESVVEIDDPEQARIIKSAFDRLHGQYGSQLEQFRREALATIGTRVQPADVPTRREPVQRKPLEVPDPDRIFADKTSWAEGLGRSLEGRLSEIEQRNEALVRAAVDTVQEEFGRREMKQQAEALQSQLVAKTFENHPGLAKRPALFWATVDENWETLRHLPVDRAFEHAGELAASQLPAGDDGEQRQPVSRRAPAAPVVLSSARRGAASREPEQPKPRTLGERIYERQARYLKGAK